MVVRLMVVGVGGMLATFAAVLPLGLAWAVLAAPFGGSLLIAAAALVGAVLRSPEAEGGKVPARGVEVPEEPVLRKRA
jgi:hypothetical protein